MNLILLVSAQGLVGTNGVVQVNSKVVVLNPSLRHSQHCPSEVGQYLQLAGRNSLARLVDPSSLRQSVVIVLSLARDHASWEVVVSAA